MPGRERSRVTLEGGTRLLGTRKCGTPGRPLVSVITVVYNNRKHLEETIRSVLSQSYDPVEYIIVDGGSTDGTLDIIREYGDRIDFWRSEPDEGISDAMNKGVRLATGDLIAHLHSDDYYKDDGTLSAVAGELLRHPGALWLTGGIDIVDPGGRVLQTVTGRKYSYRKLVRGNFILHPATFVTREGFGKAGLFDPAYRYSMDYDLWLRLGTLGDPVTIDRRIACFRAHPASLSVSKSDRAYQETWEIRKKYLKGGRKELLGQYLQYSLKRIWARAYYRGLLLRAGDR